MQQNWWDQDPDAHAPQNTQNPYNLPVQPATPMQQQQMQATQQDMVYKGQQIENNPLNRANTQTNIDQGQTSIASQRQQMRLGNANAASGLYKDFTSDQIVKSYREVAPRIAAAESARHDGPGDTTVVYAWAKAMDPTGSVREGDTQMAQNASGPMQRAQFLVSQYHLDKGGTLPPEVRTGLIEEMRTQGKKLHEGFQIVYRNYANLAKQNGISPDVFGADPANMYSHEEMNYISANGGTPRINGVPVGPNGAPQIADAPTEGQFRDQAAPHVQLSPEQEAKDKAFLRTNPTPEQYAAFLAALQGGGSVDKTAAAARLKALQSGAAYNAAIGKPDISDVRNKGDASDSINSLVRGVGDTVSLGALDKGIALGDTVFKGGTFDQNLNRQYAISDFDQQNHPWLRLGGEALGGAVLPMGDMSSLANVAMKGAGYGAAYGLGSSRSLSDIAPNMIGGAAVGAAVPAALGKLFPAKAPGVDPLVDPVTGELNVPFDSMTPAERLATMNGYGMKTVTPGMVGGRSARIMEQAFNNLPGSAGTMEDVNAAASGELRRSMQGTAQLFGTAKTLNEGGSALQSGANQWMDRAQQTAGKLYSRIPIAPDAPTSLANTTATLSNLSDRFSSNPELAGMMNNPKFSNLLNAFQQHGLSWQDLKDFRSMIGDKIGEMRFGENDNTKDFRALYGALSQDMKDTAAAQGPKALAAFNRANDFYQQKESVIDSALTRILGPNAKARPELAASAVQAMTKGGKASGDLRTLAQIRAATVKSGAWDEIASTLIHLGGQPANSEGRAFQPQTFVQWYADMSEPARALLFKPEQRKALDGFVAMNQQLARIKGLANTSNTAPNVVGSGILMTAAASLANPILGAKLAVTMGGNWALGKLWTNPNFVRLMTGLGRAGMTGSKAAVQSQVGRLAKFAAHNPEFSEPVQAILRQIANDNFVGPIAASPDANQKQDQQQPY